MLGTTIRRSEYGITRTRKGTGTGRKVGVKPAAPSVATTCTAPLTLPTLSSRIPKTYVIDSSSMAVANIALHLFDLGVVTEEEAALSTLEIIQYSLSRWCRNRTEKIRHFHPTIRVSDILTGCGVWDADYERILEQEGIVHNAPLFTIGVYYRDSHCFTLSERCMPLHQIEPTFMEYAVNLLYRVLNGLMFAVNPELAYQTAEHFYWDWCDEGEENEVTREVFHAEIPKWVADPSIEMPEEGLSRFLKHDDANIQRIAHHLASWEKLAQAVDQTFLPYSPEDCSEEGVTIMQNGTWVAWDGGELFNRIMDDWGEYNCQCGTTDLNRFFVTQASKEGIEKALAMLGHYFDRLLWADRLLGMLGTREK